MTDWHASDEALRSWVDDTAGPLAGASVEQHIGRCERCRGVVASLVPADDVPGSWESILEAVELPSPSLGVRLMTSVSGSDRPTARWSTPRQCCGSAGLSA